jgi:hypothetical protein
VQASAITAEVQTAVFVQEPILDRLRFGEGNVFSSGAGLTGTIGNRFAPGTTLPAAYGADLRQRGHLRYASAADRNYL